MMATTKQTTVWCDETDCDHWIQLDEERVRRARQTSHTEGWSSEGDYDFCPIHTKERKKKARVVRVMLR